MTSRAAARNDGDRVLTVGQLTAHLKAIVETEFPRVTVLGEISNCTEAASGHVYLTLKDDFAQIRAVIWRSKASRIRFDLHDGLEIVATGAVEIYAPRGSYQFIIDNLAPQGVGALELAFRQVQAKLSAEGLFDPARKRPLPQFPRRIAIITSPNGAAVRDLLQVITRRWRASDLVVLPVPVQGDGAARKIAAALNVVAELPEVDVVVVGRGGGSLEDLWAFNEEIVARAIFECPVPVVSAVGHEIDVTIADLVADRRALTPSEAGELVVPERTEVAAQLDRLRQQLVGALQSQASQGRARLDSLATRRLFTRPMDAVRDRAAEVDDLADRLSKSMKTLQERRRQNIAAVAGTLHALSPFAVLQRGYSVTQHADSRLVRSINNVQIGDRIETVLADGSVISHVESTEGINRQSPGS